LTDGQGIPLSVVVITAANTHDMKADICVLDNTVVKRPSSKVNKERQNLCPDKGYDFQEIEVHEPIKDIYHIFDIEGKQLVIKINGGNKSLSSC
jgi:hypothetical protein